MSGVEEDGDEDSDEPDGWARERQSIPCCAWSCGNSSPIPTKLSNHDKATYHPGQPGDSSLDMLLRFTTGWILQIEGQMDQADGCRGIRAK